MLKRFIIDDGALVDRETNKKYYFLEEVVDFINGQEYEKINYKRELNTLKYRIKNLIED